MNIREIGKPLNSNMINENIAKKFGQKINLDKFTIEQLEDARNKVRTKLSQYETNESFDKVFKDDSYQKNKLFLDLLNTAIEERADSAESQTGSVVKEGAEDTAELVMAAKDMVDRITSWMEDTAEMQTESMLELADAIRDEMGTEQSESFVATVKPALEQLYGTLETTRESLTAGVGMLTGEGEPMDTMGADDMDMEPTVDAEDGMDAEDDIDTVDVDGEDEFAGAETSAGGEEEAGRAKRESIERSRGIAKILASKKK